MQQQPPLIGTLVGCYQYGAHVPFSLSESFCLILPCDLHSPFPETTTKILRTDRETLKRLYKPGFCNQDEYCSLFFFSQADNIKIQRNPSLSFSLSYYPLSIFLHVPFSSFFSPLEWFLSLLESKRKKSKTKYVAQRYYRVLKHVSKCYSRTV